MASFQSNVEEKLDADDYKMKLTLLLQHCTGKALELIEDCVMLPPHRGYATALEKLEKWFGRNHHIARSYINSVTKGSAVKLNDVEALVQLALDMGKCQTVLSELQFTSDLDSTGTILSIVRRLPDSFQMQWIRHSNKILKSGREATFNDLTLFVEARADEYSSLYGQSYAEQHCSSAPSTVESENKKVAKTRNEPIERVTTLATDTAGPDIKPRCTHCAREGHVIWRCVKFKGLSIDRRKEVANKLNLCIRCLKDDHDSTNCQKRCGTCDGEHSTLLHDQTETKETSDNGDE